MHHRTRQTSIRRHPHVRPLFAGLRHYDRKDAEFEVVVVDEDGWQIPFVATNVSESGVFLRSDLLFQIGDTHRLQLRRAGSTESVELRGRVVRVEGGRGCPEPGMAYEFVMTDRKTFHGLTEFVAAL